jgi:hypothetical protein
MSRFSRRRPRYSAGRANNANEQPYGVTNMEINALTIYLILGVGCALASWAEDFQNPNEKRLHFWEYVFIITLGPVLAAINLTLLVRERWQQRKQRG